MKKKIWTPDIGLIKDAPPTRLKSGALTGATNVRMRDGLAMSAGAYSSVYGTPQVAPLFVMPVVKSTNDHFWLYAGLQDVYVVDESDTHSEISDVVYNASADIGWNGGIFGTIPFVNNGVDVPREWATVSTGTNLSKLSNWETDVASGATCRVLRSFGQYMVALNLSEGGTDYTSRVRWSDKGSAGSMPGWDASDTTQDAGFEDLLEAYTDILDGFPLRDRFVIYREGSCLLMSLVGGSRVMKIAPLFQDVGIFATGCVDKYRGRHFVLTPEDFIQHDGNTWDSIIDGKNRRYLFSLIDGTNYERTFVHVNPTAEEVWVCFPEDDQSYATRALVMSFQDGKWTERELPGVRDMSQGEVEQGTITWETLSPSTWEAWGGTWDDTQYSPVEGRTVMAGTDDTKLYETDRDNTADGTAVKCGISRESDPFGDVDQVVRLHKVIPTMEASEGMTFTLRVGAQDKYSDPIDWKTYTYTHGTDKEFNVRSTGKLISWELYTEGDGFWRLEQLEFVYEGMGWR